MSLSYHSPGKGRTLAFTFITGTKISTQGDLCLPLPKATGLGERSRETGQEVGVYKFCPNYLMILYHRLSFP